MSETRAVLTGDTITDDQIRNLRDRIRFDATHAGIPRGFVDTTDALLTCAVALGEDDESTHPERVAARNRCAQIANAQAIASSMSQGQAANVLSRLSNEQQHALALAHASGADLVEHAFYWVWIDPSDRRLPATHREPPVLAVASPWRSSYGENGWLWEGIGTDEGVRVIEVVAKIDPPDSTPPAQLP